ncbi:hypothetical protein ACVM2Z_000684 [Citrobacter freundii]
MTDLLYAKTTNADDGCDWGPVIIWRMNAGARARNRACYVPAPRPIQVNPVSREAKPKKAPVQAVNTSGRWLKTHTATVITAKGEKTVKIRETATVWSAGSNENYDKLTGQRVGAPGRCRLLLESITPIARKAKTAPKKASGELSAQKLVALMKGKTLSYQGILTAIKKYHPDINITPGQLQKRIWRMVQSKYVGIERHDDMPVTHFTLKSVDPRFYTHSEKSVKE